MAILDGHQGGHERESSTVGGHGPSPAESGRARSSSVKTNSRFSEEKPIASGNGVYLYISLAEPALYLQGFDHGDSSNRTTTMLRGTFRLKVTKSAKIKSVTLSFRGRAETEWPEGKCVIVEDRSTKPVADANLGIPPRKIDFKDKESLMNHIWPFFNAQFQTAELGSGADQIISIKGTSTTTKETGVSDLVFSASRIASASATSLTTDEAKRRSLQLNQSHSFEKGEVTSGRSVIAQKGYRTFAPGEYIYSFELPIDSRLPESINVELGSVKYELEATVERAGAFRANLVGMKEVTFIRAPSEGSLESVEPIAISRNWEDQLHYDIVISGKSFPLGAQVPIAFKLTPLAKVQCHRIKVFIIENVQYYTTNKRVHRLEPIRKILLLEKRADGPSTSAYPGSTIRITAGGGVAYDGRVAAAEGDENVLRDSTSLLGNLEGEHNIGPTEMEFNVQLPSCAMMKEKEKSQRLHFDTTYHGIQVHHWIKVCDYSDTNPSLT